MGARDICGKKNAGLFLTVGSKALSRHEIPKISSPTNMNIPEKLSHILLQPVIMARILP